MAENGLLTGTAVLPVEVGIARAGHRHIGQWLCVAHHMIREGEPLCAYEAMLSAIWLMGVHHGQDSWAAFPKAQALAVRCRGPATTS